MVRPEFQGSKIFDLLYVYTDGAARGNPGPAGIGVVITTRDGKEVASFGEAIGPATNNYAEYTALIHALRLIIAFHVDRLCIFSDSELMVQQLRGDYKVKEASLKSLHQQLLSMLGRYREWRIEYISRNSNREADRLANEAIDRYLKEGKRAQAVRVKEEEPGQPTLFDEY